MSKKFFRGWDQAGGLIKALRYYISKKKSNEDILVEKQ